MALPGAELVVGDAAPHSRTEAAYRAGAVDTSRRGGGPAEHRMRLPKTCSVPARATLFSDNFPVQGAPGRAKPGDLVTAREGDGVAFGVDFLGAAG